MAAIPLPAIDATYAYVGICNANGTYTKVYGRQETTQHTQASTTKCTTLDVASDWIANWTTETYTITSNDTTAVVGGTSAGLVTGDTLRLADLAHGMMFPSGNDAATSIARYVGNTYLNTSGTSGTGGGLTGFVAAMNLKATAYGYANTHFLTVHGVTTAGHYTCAQELAISAHKCFTKTFPATVGTRGSWQRVDVRAGYIWEGGLVNPAYYPGCFGGKGGSSDTVSVTEGCLAHTDVATRGGVTLCAAVISNFAAGGSRNGDARALFDYAFAVLGVTSSATGRIHYSNNKWAYTGATWARSGYDTSLFAEGYAFQSATVGDKATLSGKWKQITWRGRVGPDRGKATVAIDGVATTVDCYNPTPASADLFTFTDTVARTHTIEITVATKNASSTGNTIDIDYVDAVDQIEAITEIMPNQIPNKVMDTSTGQPSTSSGVTTITLAASSPSGVYISGGSAAGRTIASQMTDGQVALMHIYEQSAAARWVLVDCTYHSGAGTITYNVADINDGSAGAATNPAWAAAVVIEPRWAQRDAYRAIVWSRGMNEGGRPSMNAGSPNTAIDLETLITAVNGRNITIAGLTVTSGSTMKKLSDGTAYSLGASKAVIFYAYDKLDGTGEWRAQEWDGTTGDGVVPVWDTEYGYWKAPSTGIRARAQFRIRTDGSGNIIPFQCVSGRNERHRRIEFLTRQSNALAAGITGVTSYTAISPVTPWYLPGWDEQIQFCARSFKATTGSFSQRWLSFDGGVTDFRLHQFNIGTNNTSVTAPVEWAGFKNGTIHWKTDAAASTFAFDVHGWHTPL